VALTDDELLASCLGALQRVAARHEQLVVSVCGILAARGDACRSAIVCRLCADPRSLAQVGCTWGVDYVNAGASGIVENACRLSASLELGEDLRSRMSKAALAAASGTGRELDEALAALQDMRVTSSLERRDMEHVHLMADSRNFLRSPLRQMRQTAVDSCDGVGTSYLDHIHAMRLLSMGRFGEAYAFMSSDMLLHEAWDLPSALLCDDLYLATMLAGAVPDARERALFDSARRFYDRGQLSRLQHYHAAFEHIPAVLMGLMQDTVAIEEAAIRAERAGDVYLHAVLMAVLAVRDIRLRAFSRAHVRASRAAAVGRSLEQEYLASGAEFVDALALEQMGEVGALGDYCATSDRMRGYALLGRIAAHVLQEGPGPEVEMVVPLGTPCPREVLWAVDLLAYGCGRVSDSFRSSLPSTWTELLLRQKERLSEVFDGGASMATEEVARPALAPASAPMPVSLDQGMQAVMPVEQGSAAKVRIAVFGGLRVEVDGKVVRDTVFDRRRAREFVLLLATVSGHRMRRFHIIAVLWPDADYYRGPRKLYEAASEARKALGGSQHVGNAIVADRAQGSLGFDTALVSCDVDDFEREAHTALSEDGDDPQILEHARRAQRIYGSGPDVRLLSLGARVRERLSQLDDLYVDTLVVAAEAALRMNKAKLAVRLAQDAHSRAGLREDVMMILIRSLPATGRTHEIKSLYRHYARRLIEEEGMAPSPALRQAVEMALEARRDVDSGTLTA
jgi:two-component SAPR family response regulator